MRVELTMQEYRWLAGLAKKAKTEASLANKETPHPLLELRRDNMSALEAKLNAAIQKQVAKERNGAR